MSAMSLGLGFSINDKDFPMDQRSKLGCLASSSPKGVNAYMNFLEAKRQCVLKEFQIVPWQDRIQIPVFRGTAHGHMEGISHVKSDQLLDFVLQRCLRCQVVQYSTLHPDLVNAKFHAPKGELFNWKYRSLLQENATNGLHYFLPFSKVPEHKYYTNYQSALVLCGIGAAFRTAIHLSTETAVVLQDCPVEEWFTRLMTPWEHFIPLDYKLNTLNETMRWIHENPEKVREISLKGRQFYLDYLSFERTEEFLYEFLYRLAVKMQLQQPPQRLGARDGRIHSVPRPQ
jgi:hypothetical protein